MKKIYGYLLILCIFSVGAYATCGEGQWQCNDNECIDDLYRCDGVPHCKDKSDETMENCMNWRCPKYAFRCAYGACVLGVAMCNGKMDCADNSDELPIVCNKMEEMKKLTGKCSSDEFECAPGECIHNSQLCDGPKDCANGSDETLQVCAKFPCMRGAFQCGYGACIAGSARCNETVECHDGSDEVYTICNQPRPTAAAWPTIARTTAAPATTAPIIGCRIPSNRFHMTFKNFNTNTTVQPGTTVSRNTIVVLGCYAGFVMKKNNLNMCTKDGWKTPFPNCFQFCNHENLLKDLSTTVTCSYDGAVKPCGERIEPGTVVDVKCSEGYERPEKSHPSDWQIICMETYKWNQAKTTCDQVCGKLDVEAKFFSQHGNVVKIKEIPWHVGIYANLTTSISGQFEPECGGTIISENLVITAAHCFWDDAAKEYNVESDYAVVAGKTCLGFDCKDAAHKQVRYIKEIVTDGFGETNNNNYKHDIAVILLSEPFRYSKWVRPICLKFLSAGAAAVDTVTRHRYFFAAWNNLRADLALNESKLAYQTLDVQTLSYRDCKEYFNEFDYQLPEDKFCLRPLREEGKICGGDSGSGIVELVDGRHRLVGVINNSPSATLSCTDSRTQDTLAATNVHHMPDKLKTFIADNLLRQKIELN